MNAEQNPNNDPDEPVLSDEISVDDEAEASSEATDAALEESLQAAEGASEAATDERLREAEQRALRSQAELENFRKRMQRDTESQLRFANLPLFRDLLPVLDNLHRALEAAEKSPEAEGLREGVQLVEQQFAGVLEKFACKRIPAEGELFDPNYHEAIGQVPSELEPGMIVHVAVEGYQVHDRVVRPAQVLVSAGPAEASEG